MCAHAPPAPSAPGLGASARCRPTTACGRPAIRRRARAARSRSSSTARRRCRAIAEALAERARSCTSPAGTSRRTLSSERRAAASSLGALLAELAERIDVRVLVWAGRAGAGLPPDARGRCAKAVATLTRGTNIRCAARPARASVSLPPREDDLIDGEVAFVGGIDLTDDGRRPLRLERRIVLAGASAGTTSARACAARRSPTSHDHFALRWDAVTGERLDRCPPGAAARATSRSRSCARWPRTCMTTFPRGDFRILESYMRALRSAHRLIYLENQFLWSPEIVAVLADKLRHPPRRRLPPRRPASAKANNGQDDTRGQLGVLADADDGAGASWRRRFARAAASRRPALRARQGRDRRRPLADRRVGQPQRALAAQRHRDERRHRRRARWRATRACGCGPSTSSSSPRRSPRRPGVVVDELWRPDRRRAARAPRSRGAADASADRAARRLEALDGACSGRWRAWPSTADACFARSLRVFRATLTAFRPRHR